MIVHLLHLNYIHKRFSSYSKKNKISFKLFYFLFIPQDNRQVVKYVSFFRCVFLNFNHVLTGNCFKCEIIQKSVRIISTSRFYFYLNNFFKGGRMDDYTSQVLALIGNLLFFAANILVTLVSFAFLSVTLKHLGLITEKPSKKYSGTQINDSPDDFVIEISDADLIGETDPNVSEFEFQFSSNNIESPNPFVFDEPEPDTDQTFVLDKSDDEGFNVDGVIFLRPKKLSPINLF